MSILAFDLDPPTEGNGNRSCCPDEYNRTYTEKVLYATLSPIIVLLSATYAAVILAKRRRRESHLAVAMCVCCALGGLSHLLDATMRGKTPKNVQQATFGLAYEMIRRMLPFLTSLFHCFASAMPFLRNSGGRSLSIGSSISGIICSTMGAASTSVVTAAVLILAFLGAAYDTFDAVIRATRWQCISAPLGWSVVDVTALMTHSFLTIIPSLCNVMLCCMLAGSSSMSLSSAGLGIVRPFRKDALCSLFLLICLWFPYSFAGLCSLHKGDCSLVYIARLLIFFFWLFYPLLKILFVRDNRLLMKKLLCCLSPTHIYPIAVEDVEELHCVTSFHSRAGANDATTPRASQLSTLRPPRTSLRSRISSTRERAYSYSSREKVRRLHRSKRISRTRTIKYLRDEDYRVRTPSSSRSLSDASLYGFATHPQALYATHGSKTSIENSDVEELELPRSIIFSSRNSSFSSDAQTISSLKIRKKCGTWLRKSSRLECSYSSYTGSSVSGTQYGTPVAISDGDNASVPRGRNSRSFSLTLTGPPLVRNTSMTRRMSCGDEELSSLMSGELDTHAPNAQQ